MTRHGQLTADAVNPQSVGSELVVQVRDRRSGRFVGHGYPSERKKPQGAAKDVRGIAVVPSYYIATPAILLAHREGEAPAEPPKRRQAFGGLAAQRRPCAPHFGAYLLAGGLSDGSGPCRYLR